ncbi:MAG TPA: zinc ribbon domain-containing protein [Blastocatellia bacterium]|nr:zinc ribbon domain-containing protein [Blastocatellia bacterium]
MFCQECGKQIRDTARFCNGCGSLVRQRFNAAPPPPAPQPVEEKRAASPRPDDFSTTVEIRDPSGDHTAVVPVVPGESVRARNRAEQRTLFEPSSAEASRTRPPQPALRHDHSGVEASKNLPPRKAAVAARDGNSKAFFTRAFPATVNPRHNHLVIVTSLLLLGFVLLLLLFYFAAKFA